MSQDLLGSKGSLSRRCPDKIIFLMLVVKFAHTWDPRGSSHTLFQKINFKTGPNFSLAYTEIEAFEKNKNLTTVKDQTIACYFYYEITPFRNFVIVIPDSNKVKQASLFRFSQIFDRED